MAFDGLITKSIINELNNTLIGGKINKIYQPNKNEIVLDIYNKNKFLLNICIDSSNCRINLTTHTKPNPKTAPNFCMLLRKYLIGSKILSFDTHNLDRIITIRFESYNELNDLISYKLIVELMGKHSNIILVNEKDIILDALRHINGEQSFRNILPANPYIFPMSNKLNLLNISTKEYISAINKENNKNLVDIFSKLFTGISKSFMIYTLKKLEIPFDNFTDNNLLKLYKYIILITNGQVICEEFELNKKKDYCITSSDTHNFSINSFIDNFYYKKETEEAFKNYRNNVLKLILSLLNKYNKKLSNMQVKLDECKNMNKYKLYGELITSNLYKINNNINLDNITLENYYDNNNLITISLDKKFSPSYNAKNFFKKYNKLKNTIEIVSKQKEDTKKNLDYIESIIYSLNSASTINDVDDIYLEIQENLLDKKIYNKKSNKKQNDTFSPISLNIDGHTVYVGKNNKQNDYLTFKVASKNDLWFHAKDIHGSHVILKIDSDKDIDESLIYKCASLAAYYSKAKDSSKVLVQYTSIKNIKKPKNAKPGFVIFNTYKTINVTNN